MLFYQTEMCPDNQGKHFRGLQNDLMTLYIFYRGNKQPKKAKLAEFVGSTHTFTFSEREKIY